MAVINPRPYITAAKATELRTLLADAKTKADASNTAAAIPALEDFKRAAAGEPALVSAGSALIAQLQGTPVDTSGTGVTSGRLTRAIPRSASTSTRRLRRPSPARRTRSSSTVAPVASATSRSSTSSTMFQQLGAANGFDVDIWDPSIGGSPGR